MDSMMNYKEYLNLFEDQQIWVSKKDGKIRYYVARRHLKMTKYEMKPRYAFAYYSRHLSDPIAYQEIDLNAFISNQLRSTSHYSVKEIDRNEIVYIYH
jgi:hypothetical protein